jgi:hypothetical protein
VPGVRLGATLAASRRLKHRRLSAESGRSSGTIRARLDPERTLGIRRLTFRKERPTHGAASRFGGTVN